MGADWSKPTERDLYTVVLEMLKERDKDAITLFFSPGSNIPLKAIRFNRLAVGLGKLEEWDGTNWIALKLDFSGGGTGAETAAGARANLGIGTMGLQNNNTVNITGGGITGLITLDLSGNLTFFANDSYSIGTILKQAKNVFVSSGLKLPVGVDKWIPK